MTNKLGAIKPTRKTGDEFFVLDGQSLPFNLIGFWRWSASDLITNTSRGVLAEFIVAKALDAADGVRYDWGAYDLTVRVGRKDLKVEVKSKAFLQSWEQDKLELNPLFVMKKSQPLDEDKSRYSGKPTRQADIYVFALLAETDKSEVNPMILNQWEFYILPTSVLNKYKRSQHSITLKSLRNLPETIKADFTGLKKAVQKASELA
jgi:hypothetical protein